MKKVLVLVSGGLDSQLAVKLLQQQGFKITGLVFKSLFFKEQVGVKACQQLGISYQIVDISQPHLKLVKQPQYGRGAAANPCLDCHLLMLKQAKKIMDKQGFDYVATGEVIGQRPFSQNQVALKLLAQRSGLKANLRRPLIEAGISGRSRQKQLKLAAELGIKAYIQPAGGCILTEKIYGQKLLNLFQHWPNCHAADIQLLRLGRVIWFGQTLGVIGRNHQDNQLLTKSVQSGDLLLLPKNFPGPTVLIRSQGKISKTVVNKAKKLILKYSKPIKNPGFEVILN